MPGVSPLTPLIGTSTHAPVLDETVEISTVAVARAVPVGFWLPSALYILTLTVPVELPCAAIGA